jgi:hypothetical protein
LSDPASLANEIAALTESTTVDLKRRWRLLYGAEPPQRISRDLLTRARLSDSGSSARRPETVDPPVAGAGCRRCLGATAHPGGTRADSQTGNRVAAQMARHRAPNYRPRGRHRVPGHAVQLPLSSRAPHYRQQVVGALVLRAQSQTSAARRWIIPDFRHAAARSTPARVRRRASNRTSIPCKPSARPARRSSGARPVKDGA